MFYKVVEGLVPAIAPNYYLIPSRNKRQIRAKQYFVCSNIVERREKRNASSFQITNNNTDIQKHSFFEPSGRGTISACKDNRALYVPSPV
jgi:hypothetical protein